MHGGVLLTLIDQAGAYAGLYCAVPGRVRKAVTVDLDCRFTGQARTGVLRAEGVLLSRGRSLFFARTEIFGPDGERIAFGASTHRYRAGSEQPEGVPRESERPRPAGLGPQPGGRLLRPAHSRSLPTPRQHGRARS